MPRSAFDPTVSPVLLALPISPLAVPTGCHEIIGGLGETSCSRVVTNHCARAVVAKPLTPAEPAVDLVTMVGGDLADEMQL